MFICMTTIEEESARVERANHHTTTPHSLFDQFPIHTVTQLHACNSLLLLCNKRIGFFFECWLQQQQSTCRQQVRSPILSPYTHVQKLLNNNSWKLAAAPGEQEMKKKNRRQQEENGFIVYWIFIFVLFSVKVLQIKTCLSANNRVVSRGESDLKLSLFQAEIVHECCVSMLACPQQCFQNTFPSSRNSYFTLTMNTVSTTWQM